MAAGVDPERLVGTLYVVATPIGNLEDITLRALRVLSEVTVIAAEDTRRTRQLLLRHGIDTPLISYREQNRASSTPLILRRLESGSVALVSDAGMPGISDPGGDLIAAVIEMRGRVEVIPGANAALTALVASGLPVAPFTFVGFLSRQRGDRRRQLLELAPRAETLIFYEAPHRLIETLRDMQPVFGERAAAACRELTKRHEEIWRGSLAEMLAHFTAVAPRGEFTLVIAGAQPSYAHKELLPSTIDQQLLTTMKTNSNMRLALTELSTQSGVSRRTLYARWQTLRRQEEDLRRTGTRDGLEQTGEDLGQTREEREQAGTEQERTDRERARQE